MDNALDRSLSFSYDPNDRLTQEQIVNSLVPSSPVASTTRYEYGTLGAGGSLAAGTTLARVTKFQGTNTSATGIKLNQTEYRYDVAGRTAEVKIESFGSSPSVTTTSFTYDHAGTRLSKTESDGLTSKTTLYTVDAANPTGYAQVIEELTTTSGSSGTQVRTSYVIGLDVIAQQSAERTLAAGTWSAWQQQEMLTLLYDGHGSTRALLIGVGSGSPNSSPPIPPAQIATGQLFTYDAYGQMLPRFIGTSEVAINPKTTLLYSGEQTDGSTGLQYLRARYYSPASGRFAQMDPFAGTQTDPQSLHKYLYAHANPVMNADPSGEFALLLAPIIGASVGLTAALDAHLGGEDDLIVSSFVTGFILGTVLAPVMSAIPGISLAAGIGLGVWGTATANTPEQAIFRGLLTLGGAATAARLVAANLRSIAGAAQGFNGLVNPPRLVSSVSSVALEMPAIYATTSEIAIARIMRGDNTVSRIIGSFKVDGQFFRFGDTYVASIHLLERSPNYSGGLFANTSKMVNALILEAQQSGARQLKIYGMPNQNTQRLVDDGFLSRAGFRLMKTGSNGEYIELTKDIP